MRQSWELAVCLLLHAGVAINQRAQKLRRTSARPVPTFAREADLPTLREQVVEVERELASAVGREDYSAACTLRDRVTELRTRDPQHRFTQLCAALRQAVAVEDYSKAADLHTEMLSVKHHLPQFQLAGLWRGLYPHHGDETIRLRYSRDDPNRLIATKVTGDDHVPRGEVTFTADLLDVLPNSPQRTVVRRLSSGAESEHLVTRYTGSGQVATKGFTDPCFVEGELFMFDTETVGFMWVPFGQLILFSRVDGPEAEIIEEQLDSARTSDSDSMVIEGSGDWWAYDEIFGVDGGTL
mmetsp:Transcript_3822/g.9908  ORF Transcript_3822/g.9908 Transcript_3822/m.9908 type:complete len:296 (-) Transcript_3822:85-972(-)